MSENKNIIETPRFLTHTLATFPHTCEFAVALTGGAEVGLLLVII